MSNKTILYFDKVLSDFKKILFLHKPDRFDLLFWHEMNEREREESLSLAEYLMVATQKIDSDTIRKAAKAKLIQKTGIGVDNINLDAARQLGIPVANTPGANATGVAELTILLILALYRKLIEANDTTKKGLWRTWELRPFSFEMSGKTHGFIGFGNIGRETARRSAAFGTQIVYYDAIPAPQSIEQQLSAEYLSLEELLKTSDIISLHLPLLPETANLIGKTELAMMKRNAILINVSRGGIVDEDALYDRLTNKRIAGAALDVWKNEPVPADHPLLTLGNVIATPHIGAGTRDTLDNVLRMAFANIKRTEEKGKPDCVVNGVESTERS